MPCILMKNGDNVKITDWTESMRDMSYHHQVVYNEETSLTINNLPGPKSGPLAKGFMKTVAIQNVNSDTMKILFLLGEILFAFRHIFRC